MEFQDFCGVCGIALYKHEVAAEIRGDVVDYDEKMIGKCSITLCRDCKNKVFSIAEGGVDVAASKRYRIDFVAEERDRDDGDGGIAPRV